MDCNFNDNFRLLLVVSKVEELEKGNGLKGFI